MDAITRIEALERQQAELRSELEALRRQGLPPAAGGLRLLPALVALLVVVLTIVCAGRASAVSQVPNVSYIGWSLAAGAVSSPITIPATNEGVLVTGTTSSVGVRGVGQVTIVRTHLAPFFLQWVGLHSPSNPAITAGDADERGILIVYIDLLHKVRIEVASPSEIRVHNTANALRTGNVKLIW
jgi:hypothetical protein